MRTKTEFRAVRNMTGITQAALAKRLGVEVRSVKRWESPTATQQPPTDAWDVLDAAHAAQRRAVEAALAQYDAIAERVGHEPTAVRLPYWAGAEEYAAHSTDAALGVETGADSWRMANANAQAVASILEAEGVVIDWTDDPLGDAPIH